VTVTSARLRLVDIDIAAAGCPLFGAAMREGRSDAARRTRLKVTGPDGLEVRGRDETELCLKDLAAAVERGDGAPIVLGAERVR
jgi:hypothetical protein